MNDDFEDLKRAEAYENYKNEQMTKAVGKAFYLYIIHAFSWLINTLLIMFILNFIFEPNEALGVLTSMILSFFLFKISYIKENPFNSLMTSCFILFLIFVLAS